ncbi:MAG: alcohol dehydrogenase catalytic domain-containing protein [Chloroflexota bacterium]|nr:alcohol dehydrogenase catalytic domain-containing protein [Chloroflexota bacterium]
MNLPQTVRAVHITAPDRFEIVEKPLPDVPPGYALAAPSYVGLCGTDLDLFNGSMPYFDQGFAEYPLQPGHEWSGTLLQPTKDLPVGTRVILDPIIDCGRDDCELCNAGLVVRCVNRREIGVRNGLDGALATVVAVPTRYLLPIPDGVATRDAALVEPMVTTLEGIRRTDPQPGDEVLIVGAATLGLAGAMILSARGIRTHVLLRSDVRVPTVEATGAIPWVAGTRTDVEKFDVVIEAAGTPAGVQASLELAAPGGRVALLGVPTTLVEVDVATLVIDDITIKGVLNGPGQYPNGLAAIASGEVKPELLIDRVYPFEDVEAALARSKERGREHPKVLVAVGEDGA